MAGAEGVASVSAALRWLALGGALAAQAVSVGATIVAFGFLQVPVAAELGARIDVVSLGIVLFMPAQALFGLVLGRLVDRFGPRAAMLLGSVISALGCALISRASSLGVAGAGFVVAVAAGSVALGPLPASKLVSDWFPERRGTALGISGVGPSIGALAAPKLIPLALEAWGWRGAVLACAVAFALLLPILALCVHDAPAATSREAPRAGGVAHRAFVRERNFWVLTLSFGLCFAVLLSLGNAYPPYVTETRGLGARDAGTLLFASAVTGIASNVLFGRLADALPRRTLIWLAQLPIGLCCGALALEPGVSWLLPLALFGGVAQGLTALWTASIGDRFVPEVFGSVMGTMGLCMLPLTMSGLQLPMIVFARTGRFEPAFAAFAALVALAAIAIAFLVPRWRASR